MQIENEQKIPKTANKNTNKTLIRLQRPMYQLKKSNQNETEYVIKKLLNTKSDKPNISKLQRSPLFAQLQAIMPIFKKANEQLKSKGNEQSQKIDVKLQQVQDSSSSSSDQQQTTKQQKTVLSPHQQMLDQLDFANEQKNTNQIQLNILKYELPQQPIQVSNQIVQGNQNHNVKKIQQL